MVKSSAKSTENLSATNASQPENPETTASDTTATNVAEAATGQNATGQINTGQTGTTEQLQSTRAPLTDRQITVLLVALTAAIYLRTVAPDVLAGDAGQFHFTAWQLGISHPTGYPTYHIAGHLWQKFLALFGVNPSLALNAFSAVIGAIGLGVLYRFMRDRFMDERFTNSPQTAAATGKTVETQAHTPEKAQVSEAKASPEAPAGEGLSQGAAIFTALFFGWNLTYWSQNLIAEVYTLHVLFLLAIFSVALNLSRKVDWNGDSTSARPAPGRLILLAGVVGFALTHHGMTLFVIPALLLYLFTVYPGWMRQSWQTWLGMLCAGVLPLLLYLYIPLRGGPDASPWKHQRLGDDTLTLYAGDWNAFVEYITGQSISVGFNSPLEAFNQLGFAFWLWRYHFAAAGLILAGLGLLMLFRNRNYAVLTLTGGYALIQQVFNLFYNIEDILVYYIPLYLMGAIWAGFGAYALATAAWRIGQSAPPAQSGQTNTATEASMPVAGGASAISDAATGETDKSARATENATEDITAENKTDSEIQTPEPSGFHWSNRLGWVAMALLFLLPLTALLNNMGQVDQSQSTATREQWETIMATEPPQDAILATNDRDEIVGLLYMQWVEDRRRDLSGVFPLMAPDERFTDIGATLHTALAAQGQPVYLIKAMPGLEVAFDLEPATPPLIRVLGAQEEEAMFVEDRPFGPLQLEGYSWHWLEPGNLDRADPDTANMDTEDMEASGSAEEAPADNVEIRVYWRVLEPMAQDYTTTVQLFATEGATEEENTVEEGEHGARIAQSDAPPGGVYYPTSLWKPGEQIIETHRFTLDLDTLEHFATVDLLIGMYHPDSMEHLAPAVEFRAELPASVSRNAGE